MRHISSATAGLLLAGLWSGAAFAGGPVQVIVTNVKTSSGTIHVELCPEGLWLKKCPLSAEVPARTGTTVVTLPNVPAGRYGAVAYHDRNGNGKADRNFIGMPTEDVGFSNNALKGLSRPKFADAAFDHGDAEQRISFMMKSL
jgi:uncharacterized protein (DUF2141 family)